jgi:hypothetical protein
MTGATSSAQAGEPGPGKLTARVPHSVSAGQPGAAGQQAVPADMAALPALPSRHTRGPRPAGWRPLEWVPADPEILLRVRAGLERL